MNRIILNSLWAAAGASAAGTFAGFSHLSGHWQWILPVFTGILFCAAAALQIAGNWRSSEKDDEVTHLIRRDSKWIVAFSLVGGVVGAALAIYKGHPSVLASMLVWAFISLALGMMILTAVKGLVNCATRTTSVAGPFSENPRSWIKSFCTDSTGITVIFCAVIVTTVSLIPAS